MKLWSIETMAGTYGPIYHLNAYITQIGEMIVQLILDNPVIKIEVKSANHMLVLMCKHKIMN